MARIKVYNETYHRWDYADVIGVSAGGTGAVSSVNGQIGDVVITTASLGAATAAQGALADTALQAVPDTYRTAAEQDQIHDSTKQDVISDLSTIRSNAAAVSSKQDTISDLNDIRSGASAGATALQPDDVSQTVTSGTEIARIGNKALYVPSVGTIVETDITTGTATLSSKTLTTIASITLPAGIWLIIGATQTHNNSTVGRTVINITADATEYGSDKDGACGVYINTGYYRTEAHRIVSLSAETTYYLNAYGDVAGTYGYTKMTAVRIA